MASYSFGYNISSLDRITIYSDSNWHLFKFYVNWLFWYVGRYNVDFSYHFSRYLFMYFYWNSSWGCNGQKQQGSSYYSSNFRCYANYSKFCLLNTCCYVTWNW